MKNKSFTQKMLLTVTFLFGAVFGLYAQDVGTGTGWGDLSPSESLVIDENFQEFQFFHSDENPDQGNSDNTIDETTGEIIYNYRNLDTAMFFENSTKKFNYEFYQCAFAPDWQTAYAYQTETENTENVSNGFVEVSRGDTVYSTVPTIHGYVVADLTGLESVEIIQYSHSSTGGRKRGILVEFSIDSGVTWDTLRYQPGSSAWASSFTKDPFTGDKTYNEIQCEPSAYGMLWEDAIYWYDGGFMLRFGECGGQTIRLHDLKVYGTIAQGSAVIELKNDLRIKSFNNSVEISEPAVVSVYSITGRLIKSANAVEMMSLSNLSNGIYIIKAQSGNRIATEKFVKK